MRSNLLIRNIYKLIDYPIKMEKKVHNFTVVIEQDEDGYYVGDVPALRGCYTQGKTMDELLKNMKEVILLCLETEEEIPKENFVGVQQVQVVA